MNSNTNEKPAKPSGPVHSVLGGVDRAILAAWRLFISLKFGIFLLAVIGAASIYGTMGYASNPRLGDNQVPMARALFFESRWFVALLLLFAVNLILSTWHVTVMSFGIFWKKDYRRGKIYYEHGSSPRAEISVPGGAAEVEKILRQRFTRSSRDGNAFFAHKGLLSRIGPTIVHIGILTVIFSVVVKAVLIWNHKVVTEGRFMAAEGETSNLLIQPIDLAQQLNDHNIRTTNLGVWVKVLDFDEIKHPNSNVPEYFSSLVEVRDPETQQITVAQLDMNHSLTVKTKLGDLQFHQAGYQAVPEQGASRINFDVRDSRTGERIEVTDAIPGDRVRVGQTEYFLEVDGVNIGDAWRLYTDKSPEKEIASGKLLGDANATFTFRVNRFFNDLQIDPKTKSPFNGPGQLGALALEVTTYLNGERSQTAWVFKDPDLAKTAENTYPNFNLTLKDVHVPADALTDVKWNEPGAAIFVVGVNDKSTGVELSEEYLGIGQTSTPLRFNNGENPAPPGSVYEVRVMAPTQRFLTVLSVISEPTVFWTNVGVVVLVFGALLTFIFRYRAFYGLWDEEKKTLRMALVPRWGQSPVQAEFDELAALLSHGAKPMNNIRRDKNDPDEVLPEHDSVKPAMAEV